VQTNATRLDAEVAHAEVAHAEVAHAEVARGRGPWRVKLASSRVGVFVVISW
jgi:hypothetical protein